LEKILLTPETPPVIDVSLSALVVHAQHTAPIGSKNLPSPEFFSNES